MSMREAASSAAADATGASAEQRPVYIRRNQRQAKKKPKFFHGAFSGGYSAGYHNTVGSKEGWKPSEGAPNKVQTVQDYMDEEDAQEWGGPRHVRDDYQNADELRQGALHTLQQQHQQTQSSSSSAAALPGPVPREFMEASVASSTIDPVGKRLLRKLGWRGEGRSVAFVENDDDNNNSNNESKHRDTTQSDSHQAAYLSKRKMRKIKLASQSSFIQIPPPKLDLYGMGYEPFANAPEFRAHKEKRRERAEQRAREATTSSKRDATRYHTSHILDDDDKEEEHNTEQSSFGTTPTSAVNSGTTLETTEDFVGNKTVGGFALHDDADDVYDAPVSDLDHKQQNSEYHSEIVEPDEDSDVEQEQHGGLMGASSATSFFARSKEKPNMGIADLAGALSSWAGTDGKATKNCVSSSPVVVTTSDGRPPLPGFSLGGGDGASSAMERFPGPDLPDNYRLSRHAFKDSEQQAFIRQQSLAVKQESLQQKKLPVVPVPSSHLPDMGDSRKKLDSKMGPDVNEPMAGTRFASLATAMQNRFTSSTKVSTGAEEGTAKIGLISSDDIKSTGKDPNDETRSEPQKKIVVKRTVISWVPSSLLCKRLHMKNVAVSQKNPSLQSNSSKGQSEQSYFEQQVLGAAKSAAPISLSGVTKSTISKKQNEWDSFNNETDTLETKEERPPLDLFKAIFEPDSESSSESEASDNDEESSSRAPANTSIEAPLGIIKEADNLHESVNDEVLHRVRSETNSKEGRDVERSSRSRKSTSSGSADHKSSRREKRDHHSDRKKHPDRKRSRRYSDSDSDSDRRHRKHGRRDRKKDEKKKKKKRH